MPSFQTKRIGGAGPSDSANAACRMLAKAQRRAERPRVLLLQGPVGPFFRRLQKHLDANNYCAWQVSFHSADSLFSAPGKTLHFRDDPDQWGLWLQDILRFGAFQAIVLFGSERPAHRQARRLADAAGIDVICLEEGYVRPGYITVECQGNNASSPLAGRINNPATATIEPRFAAKSHGSLHRMVSYGAAYYTLRGLTTWGRTRRMFHRQTPLLPEAFYWTRNLVRRITHGHADFATIQGLLEHCDLRFYLVPLQVSADANMLRFANGWNSARLIAESIQSFARTAPHDRRLVFKIHPMERGHHNLKPLIKRIAQENAVADRIDVIETGSLGLLARHSAGMITINSTSAFSAIFHGVPLLVLGRAIYAHPTLATLGAAFDRFWTTRHIASPAVRSAYIDWIKAEALKPGDFYADAGMDQAVQSVCDKLRHSVVRPSTPTILKAAS